MANLGAIYIYIYMYTYITKLRRRKLSLYILIWGSSSPASWNPGQGISLPKAFPWNRARWRVVWPWSLLCVAGVRDTDGVWQEPTWSKQPVNTQQSDHTTRRLSIECVHANHFTSTCV